MGRVLHGSVTTIKAVRRAIQAGEAGVKAPATRYGSSATTVRKWRKRQMVTDERRGPRQTRSPGPTTGEEAVVIAFRRHVLLPLDDCLYALQPTILHLTRPSLQRRLQRLGIPRPPDGGRPGRPRFKARPIDPKAPLSVRRDVAEVPAGEGRLRRLVAIDRLPSPGCTGGRPAADLLRAPRHRRALHDPHGADR